MKLAIVGSREFEDWDTFKSIADAFIQTSNQPVDLVISGGAAGPDTMAERYAEENNIDFLEIKPDWEKYGRSAGMLRNTEIVNSCDEALVFWNYHSRGTMDTVNKLFKSKHNFIVYDYNKKELYTFGYIPGWYTELGFHEAKKKQDEWRKTASR